MSPSELQIEVVRLRRELAKRAIMIAELEAMLTDRDATIARISRDLAKLQALANQWLSRRRGGLRVPEGQGLLFGESAASNAPAEASCDDTASADGEESGDEEDDSPAPAPEQRSTGKRRTPGKIDTTGLPRQRVVHDLPEEQRVDPVSGKPLVAVGQRVTEELDYQRG